MTGGERKLHLLKNAQLTLSLFIFTYLPTLTISNFFLLNQYEISNVANPLFYLIFNFFDCIGIQSQYDGVMTAATEIVSDLYK